MKTLLFAIALCAAVLRPAAADVTGKWSGSFNIEGGDEDTAFLNLKQSGNELTGTAGPNEEKQFPIAKGRIDGDKITFEVQTDGPLLKFELAQVGDHIKGDVTGEKEGEIRKAKLDVTRKRD